MKKIFAAALFALAPFAAQAALTSSVPGWPPSGSSGLQGVQFNVVELGNGAFVAMGAHGYKNGVTLGNDGISIYTAKNGLYAPDNKGYANWSFDFVYNTGGCTTCQVFLEVDTDPTAGQHFVNLGNLVSAYGQSLAESWNMEMSFLNGLTGSNFDPMSASSTSFRLSLVNSQGFAGVRDGSAEITVNVPEPGSLSLAGLALAGIALMRRRRNR